MTAPNTVVDDMDDVGSVDHVIRATLGESKDLIAADEPITDRPRDAAGRFTPVAGGEGEWQTIPDADPVPADGAPATTEAASADAAPVIPDGHVALPALAPEKVQGFKVLDAEGEIVAPDLRFEVNFRGPNGEAQPRTLDLPKLVNYARMGVYNHEREQQANAVRTDNLQLTNRVTDGERQVQQLRQEREWLLSNPDYLMRELAKYEQENTPEARAQRERDQLDTERQHFAFTRASETGVQFLDTQIAPALETITSTLSEVTLDDLTNRLAMIIRPYTTQTQFGNYVDPRTFKQIEQAILNDLVPWAQQVHDDRAERRGVRSTPAPQPAAVPAAPDPKAKELADAQARAAKARRVGVAALKPAGGNGSVQGPPATQKPPTSNRDMEEFVVSRSLAGSGRSG